MLLRQKLGVVLDAYLVEHTRLLGHRLLRNLCPISSIECFAALDRVAIEHSRLLVVVKGASKYGLLVVRSHLGSLRPHRGKDSSVRISHFCGVYTLRFGSPSELVNARRAQGIVAVINQGRRLLQNRVFPTKTFLQRLAQLSAVLRALPASIGCSCQPSKLVLTLSLLGGCEGRG